MRGFKLWRSNKKKKNVYVNYSVLYGVVYTVYIINSDQGLRGQLFF